MIAGKSLGRRMIITSCQHVRMKTGFIMNLGAMIVVLYCFAKILIMALLLRALFEC